MSQAWREEEKQAARLDPKEVSSHREAEGFEMKGHGTHGVMQSHVYSSKTSPCLPGGAGCRRAGTRAVEVGGGHNAAKSLRLEAGWWQSGVEQTPSRDVKKVELIEHGLVGSNLKDEKKGRIKTSI